MWNKPELLRITSNILFGVCFVLIVYGVLSYALHLSIFSLRTVSVSVAPHRVAPAQIDATIRHELHGNFFTVDLDRTRRSLENIPWVRKVSVRRNFPWRLELTLEEHVALAHWGDAKLVNTHGEVFLGETDQVLPKFVGQPDSAAEVAQMYATLTEQLAPLKQEIAEISLSPRRSWRMRLSNGVLIELGREQPKQRLASFVAAYPHSLLSMQQIEEVSHTKSNLQKSRPSLKVRYVDLRYRNGFAVRVSSAESNLNIVRKRAM